MGGANPYSTVHYPASFLSQQFSLGGAGEGESEGAWDGNRAERTAANCANSCSDRARCGLFLVPCAPQLLQLRLPLIPIRIQILPPILPLIPQPIPPPTQSAQTLNIALD